MVIDLTWVLLVLPLTFLLGWLASRFDLRQLRIENRQAPKAYFKGLNYLLNEQQDEAIDAFIEAVQRDPDTSELHFALGNLFRRRGEYERAVRVHEHLLSRGDLSATDRDRAQYALALDYLKAGLLDRAETALLKLDGTAHEARARLALLAIYERSHDWVQAARVAQMLDGSGQGSFTARIAHYLCEQAATQLATQQPETALQTYTLAMSVEPAAARPRIELAKLLVVKGDPHGACDTLLEAMSAAPAAVPLIAPLLAQFALAAGRAPAALAGLQACYDASPSLDVLEALVQLQTGRGAVTNDKIANADGLTTARDWYLRHLEREPSLVAAAKWIAGEKLEHEQFHPQVQRALDHAVKPLTRYRCAACGFEATQHFWQCPGCQTWDSYSARRVEEL